MLRFDSKKMVHTEPKATIDCLLMSWTKKSFEKEFYVMQPTTRDHSILK